MRHPFRYEFLARQTCVSRRGKVSDDQFFPPAAFRCDGRTDTVTVTFRQPRASDPRASEPMGIWDSRLTAVLKAPSRNGGPLWEEEKCRCAGRPWCGGKGRSFSGIEPLMVPNLRITVRMSGYVVNSRLATKRNSIGRVARRTPIDVACMVTSRPPVQRSGGQALDWIGQPGGASTMRPRTLTSRFAGVPRYNL
jgi:hypothetical protein